MVLTGTSLVSIRNFTDRHITEILNSVYKHLNSLDDQTLNELDWQSAFKIPESFLGVVCSLEHVIFQTFGDACIFFNVFEMEDYKNMQSEDNDTRKDDIFDKNNYLKVKDISYSVHQSLSSKDEIQVEVFDSFSITFLNKTNENSILLIGKILEDHLLNSFDFLRDHFLVANYDSIEIDRNTHCYMERFDIGNIFLTIRKDYSNWSPWDILKK